MTLAEFVEDVSGGKLNKNICPFQKECDYCPYNEDDDCTTHIWEKEINTISKEIDKR